MSARDTFLGPAEAAQQLGVSTKALRLYEQRGLLKPVRTRVGWRAYGSAEMARAAEIVALRALGLSIASVARVLRGDSADLETALALQQSTVETRIQQLGETLARVRALRVALSQGERPSARELARLAPPASEVGVAFDLPWPWGGERFELRDIRPLNYIIGPLFSGKTRLARAIAQHLPNTVFVGLERLESDAGEVARRRDADTASKLRADELRGWLAEDGAAVSPALLALLAALEASENTNLVIDMVEQGLDHATQEALIAYLRLRSSKARALFLLTRSSAILDLSAVGADEAIIHCPANHSPPMRVAPHPGASGYEAVASCLASPEVRARTAGVIAIRP